MHDHDDDDGDGYVLNDRAHDDGGDHVHVNDRESVHVNVSVLPTEEFLCC